MPAMAATQMRRRGHQEKLMEKAKSELASAGAKARMKHYWKRHDEEK